MEHHNHEEKDLADDDPYIVHSNTHISYLDEGGISCATCAVGQLMMEKTSACFKPLILLTNKFIDRHAIYLYVAANVISEEVQKIADEMLVDICHAILMKECLNIMVQMAYKQIPRDEARYLACLKRANHHLEKISCSLEP